MAVRVPVRNCWIYHVVGWLCCSSCQISVVLDFDWRHGRIRRRYPLFSNIDHLGSILHFNLWLLLNRILCPFIEGLLVNLELYLELSLIDVFAMRGLVLIISKYNSHLVLANICLLYQVLIDLDPHWSIGILQILFQPDAVAGVGAWVTHFSLDNYLVSFAVFYLWESDDVIGSIESVELVV